MSRTRFAIWNYLSGLLFTAVTLLGLVVTRYLVLWLGEDRLGAARMVVDWLGYFAILEVGLSSTLAPLFARALERPGVDALRATVAGGLRVFVVVLGVGVAVAIAMLPFVTWLIPVGAADRIDLRTAWIVGVIGLIPMVFSPFRALADARQQGYRINLALTVQSLLIFCLSLLLAYRGWGITGQLAATTVATLPLVLFLTRDGLRSHPGLLGAAIKVRPDPNVWMAIASLGIPTLVIAISGRISVMTDNLVVGKIMGPGLAARFFITQRLAVLAQSQLQAVGNACWAALAELHHQGRKDDFNRRLIELSGLVSVLGVATLGPIVVFSRHFVTLWVGIGLYLGDRVVLIAAVNALLLGLVSLWFWCFSGTGQVVRMLPMTVLGAVVNLGFSIGLTLILGPIGPLLGTTISLAGISLWYLPLSLRRTFGTPIRPLLSAVGRPLLLAVPFLGLLQYLAGKVSPTGWISLAALMATASLAYLLLAAAILFDASERAVWFRRISGAVLPRI